MGIVKNKLQQGYLRTAAEQISEIHQNLSELNLVGLTEIEVAVWIQEKMNQLHVQGLAFPIIVGSGDRTLDLHAVPSDKVILGSDLVLVDIGVTYEGYCSDMTRTYSAAKKMSEAQLEIFNIIQAVQQKVIAAVTTKTTLLDLHQLAQHEFCHLLDQTQLNGKYDIQKIFPHKTSHWIGSVVHEQSPYFDEQGHAVKLQAGQTFTVEPGLYIQDTGTKYDGIGVRIEDVILMTETGSEVLTRNNH